VSPELELHALAGAYALDALDETERIAFEEHLDGCSDCSAEVRGLQEAAAELSHTASVQPPAELRIDILAAVGRVRPLPPVVDNVVALHRAKVGRSVWQVMAAACALVAVVAAGWGYQQHRDAQRPRVSAVESVLGAADSAAVSGAIAGAKSTIIYSKSQNKMILLAHGVPALSAGKTYQLWTISPDGVARSAGLFQPDARGNAEVLASGDLAGASSMGVSVEPAGGSLKPTPGQIKGVLNL
jgi:anti-sigma-K factor RskA